MNGIHDDINKKLATFFFTNKKLHIYQDKENNQIRYDPMCQIYSWRNGRYKDNLPCHPVYIQCH